MHPPKTLAAGSATPAQGLLERASELDRLLALVDEARAGRGGVAVVMGPAGIGKTSLLSAVAREAERRGVTVLTARGSELEQGFAHGLVRQLLEQRIRALDPARRADLLEGAAQPAAAVLGEAAAAGPEPQHGFAVLHGLFWVCANLAAREPLLVLADDLHWADEPSVRFLAYLGRRAADLPVLVLAAGRPPADRAREELLAQLADGSAALELGLRPLSVAGVQALMGDDVEPEFAAACHAATDGNPLLCRTLADAVRAAGVAPVAAQARRVPGLAAHGVPSDVVRRMSRVPEDARELAGAVALLGTRVPLRHAAALAQVDERAAASAADALIAQGLLRGGAELDYVHPLLRVAVLDGLPAARRSVLHRHAAELLAADGADPERVALHLLAAPGAGDRGVVGVLLEAAGRVAARGEPAAAVRHLRRALDEPPGDELRPRVLHQLGVAELHAGDVGQAAAHLRQAVEEAGDDALRRAALRDLGLALRIERRYADSVAVLQDLLDDLPEDDGSRLAVEAALHQSAMMDSRTYRSAWERCDGFRRPADASTPGGRAYLAVLCTEACLQNTGAARVLEWADLAFAGGLVAEDDLHSGLWANVGFPLVFAEGYALAARLCEAALGHAHRSGTPSGVARALLVRAVLHLRTGAVREAVADARTALELGRETGFHTWPLALGVLVEGLVELGELGEADDALREAGLGEDVPQLFLTTFALQARGALRLAQARAADAVADLEEVGRWGREGWQPWNPALFGYRAHLARALLLTGDAARAREVADEDVELARRWGGARVVGIALRTRGVVAGRLEDLREAVAVLDASGAAVEHARALVELGSAIARTGRRADARDPLTEGMERAHRCGAAALAEHAREQLVAAGARPRRLVRSGVEALTPSELRVARMAAEGMTNRQIAQALFVTLRTVQVHLTHAYQKLGIASRGELAQALGGP